MARFGSEAKIFCHFSRLEAFSSFNREKYSLGLTFLTGLGVPEFKQQVRFIHIG